VNVSGGANATLTAGGRGAGDFQELPMVALMFLTRGDLPHERTWRLFLETLPLKGGISVVHDHRASHLDRGA